MGKLSEKIDNAFAAIDRKNFLTSATRNNADLDIPLPIGYGQTNSQPYTVRLMLEWLDPKLNDKILDIGSGSGWTTALLSYLVGPKGFVYAVEKVPELVNFGKQNSKQMGIKNVKFFKAGKKLGLPEKAPFDKILVSASARTLPEELLDQLKVGGRIVIPVRSDVCVIKKINDNRYEDQCYDGFAFVPLI